MSGQEITVALEQRLSVIFVILNDASLGMVKHGQQLNDAENIGHQMPKVDFAAMAKAMGIRSHLIREPEDFMKLEFNSLCQGVGPVLLDVHIDPDEVPPMATRMRVLADQS
jgi:acetolactate synthase-1/2/3 large subunit